MFKLLLEQVHLSLTCRSPSFDEGSELPKPVVEYFRLDQDAFERSSAFNCFLDLDTRLFVDPFLVGTTQVPEFIDARSKILEHFSNVMKLLIASSKKGDRFWQSAASKLTFSEISGFGLGYSGAGIGGAGVGPKKRDQLLSAAKDVINAGIKDPQIFELVGVIEDGIGKDNISDIVCQILLREFCEYSQRVFSECGWKGSDIFRCQGQSFSIPNNPFVRKMPVLLVPKEFLRTLPVASVYGDLTHVYAENREIREKVNQMLGSDWRVRYQDALKTKEGKRSILYENLKLMEGVLAAYKNAQGVPYDLVKDPEGLVSWYREASELFQLSPMKLTLPSNGGNTERIYHVVKQICNKFLKLVEDNRLYKQFYKDEGCTQPRNEDAIQLLFYAIADIYCEHNNINLTRESDGGRGPVDFKIAEGYAGSVLVEIKKSTNTHLIQSYDKQIPIYEKADNAGRSIILIVKVSSSIANISNLLNHDRKRRLTGKGGPEIIVVDASPVPSASHA